MRPLLLALVPVLLLGCTSPDPVPREERPDAEVFTFQDGAGLDADAAIGLRVSGLAEHWRLSVGDPAAGYAQWESERLGCAVFVIVAGATADLPHDLDDAAGSARLAEQFAVAHGVDDVVEYPLAEGGHIEMHRVVEGIVETGMRVTLAREAAVIRSALYLTLTCAQGVDALDVLDRELVRRVPATLDRG